MIRKPSGVLTGEHPFNICNRGQKGKGVQLEISRGLRNKIADNEFIRKNGNVS